MLERLGIEPVTTAVQDVQAGDILTVFVKGRLRPVQAGEVAMEGAVARLKTRNLLTLRAIAASRFSSSAKLQIYRRQDVESALQACVLKILAPGMQSKCFVEIFAAMREDLSNSPGKERLKSLLARMVETGKLLETEKQYLSCRMLPGYRQPLTTCRLPMPVMERRNYRFGWVVDFFNQRPAPRPYPLVQWADGSRSLSREDWLEPLGDPRAVQAVAHAIAHLKGSISPDFVKVPREMLACLISARAGLNMTNLLLLGKYLKQQIPGYQSNRENDRDWLDRNYPGWRYGIIPYELLVLPDGVE